MRQPPRQNKIDTAPRKRARRSEMSRRTFLGGALGTASLALLRCGGSRTTPPPVGPAALDDPFGIWAELQRSLRQSPDHLVAAADRVVAAADPAAIHAFVRDQIATYPPLDPRACVTEMRWGVRATLRGGAGTPREKAELLAQLYQRAGFQARVVKGSLVDTSPATLRSIYFRRIERRFAPAIEQSTLDAYNAALGNTTARAPDVIDPSGSEAAAIAAAISAALPSGLAPHGNPEPTLQLNGFSLAPLVAVSVNGQTKYANPIFPDASFGDSRTSDIPVPAPAPDSPLSVTLRLSASSAADPTRRLPILEGIFGADDLVGRYLALEFAPVGSADVVLRQAARDLRAFLPVVSLRGPDVDDATRSRLARTGTIVTLGGDFIQRVDGGVSLNGVPIALPSSPNPAATQRVASLSVRANSAAFPRVGLSVRALDSGGRAVTGLTGADFQVSDAGAAEGFLVTSTPDQPPRVMLVVDTDDTLDTHESTAQFARQLTSAVVASFPNASIQVGGGDIVRYDLLQDPDAVIAQIGSGDTDAAWRVLAELNRQRPTVIVMASEFNPGPNVLEADKAAVAAGAPVIAIGVSDVSFGGTLLDTATMNQVAQLSGGIALPGGGIAASINAVLGLLQQRLQAPPYLLEYVAPEEGPAQRTVTVNVGGRSASDIYPVPIAGRRAAPAALAGLYLTIEVGGVAATRVLAGYSGSIAPPPGTALDSAILEQVRGMLFGTTFVSVEGAAPSISTQLDDLLSVKLATRPLWDAVKSRDAEAVRNALKSAANLFPVTLQTMQSPLRGAVDGSSLTYETGLRVVCYTQHPRFGVGFNNRVDVLPQTRWATLSDRADASFQKTIARTASLAILESHTSTTNTARLLADRTLMSLPPGTVIPELLTFVDAARRRELADLLNQYPNHYRVLPRQGFPPAFWAVEQYTGSVLGILPDGTGGGSSSAGCAAYQDASALINLLGAAAGVLGASGVAPFVFLADAVAAAFAFATMMFDLGPSAGPGADQAQIALGISILCNMAATAVSSVGGDLALLPALLANFVHAVSPAGFCPSPTQAGGC